VLVSRLIVFPESDLSDPFLLSLVCLLLSSMVIKFSEYFRFLILQGDDSACALSASGAGARTDISDVIDD
jgi:hypothetical protein